MMLSDETHKSCLLLVVVTVKSRTVQLRETLFTIILPCKSSKAYPMLAFYHMDASKAGTKLSLLTHKIQICGVRDIAKHKFYILADQ